MSDANVRIGPGRCCVVAQKSGAYNREKTAKEAGENDY